jgi:hypothetical protein
VLDRVRAEDHHRPRVRHFQVEQGLGHRVDHLSRLPVADFQPFAFGTAPLCQPDLVGSITRPASQERGQMALVRIERKLRAQHDHPVGTALDVDLARQEFEFAKWDLAQ